MTDENGGIADKDLDALLVKYNAREEIINKKGDTIGIKWILPNLAELIFHEYGYHFLTTFDSGEIYGFNGSFYEGNAEKIIRDITEKIMGESTSEHQKNEVVGYIRDKNYQKRDIFDSEPHLLNLTNGIFNLDTGMLMPHTHENYFLSLLPIEYNKDAQIHNIKTFFEQVLRPEDVPLIQEVFGYCLHRSHPIQKAFMFLGDGANGKSVTISLLKAFLGKENTCAISLQDIVKSRFSISALYNKMANLYPDIADESLQKTGLFKILTGGDMVTAEQKFKDPFSFTNHAKLIFSANKLPEVHDDSDAFFRRWIFITFPNKFEGDKADKTLLQKLTTTEELSGLFNWAVAGLKRLLTQWEFTNTKTTDEMRETYQRLASPIKAYVDDRLIISASDYILKDELYRKFCEYCSEQNLPIMAKNIFSMRLHEYVRIEDYRISGDKKRVQTWRGIRFRTPEDDKEEENKDEDVRAVRDVTPFPVLKVTNEKIENYDIDIKLRKNPDNLDNPDTVEDTP